MTSPNDISMNSLTRDGVYQCVVARQIPRQRVWEHVTSYDHQILRPSRSMDNKAVLVARVAEIRAGS